MAVTIKKKNKYEDHLTPAPSKVVGGPIKKTVTTQKKIDGKEQPEVETQEQEPGPVVPLHKLAHVQVNGSRTVNLGNFNSVRLGVSLTLPCSTDDLSEAYYYASEWVSARMEAALKEAGVEL